MAGGSRVVCGTALSVLPHAVARRGISLPRSGDPYGLSSHGLSSEPGLLDITVDKRGLRLL